MKTFLIAAGLALVAAMALLPRGQTVTDECAAAEVAGVDAERYRAALCQQPAD